MIFSLKPQVLQRRQHYQSQKRATPFIPLLFQRLNLRTPLYYLNTRKELHEPPRELRDLIYYHALVPLDFASSRAKRKEQAPVRLALLSRLEWNRLNREMADLGMTFPNTYPELSHASTSRSSAPTAP